MDAIDIMVMGYYATQTVLTGVIAVLLWKLFHGGITVERNVHEEKTITIEHK